jgi:HEAT repeat protein
MEDPSAVPELMKVLADESGPVRLNAAKALGAIGDSSAVPGLIAALNDKQEWIRREVAASLKCIGTPEALEVLEVSEA